MNFDAAPRDSVLSGNSLIGLWRTFDETLFAMHTPLFIFIYVFAVVSVFLGTLWLICRLFAWIFRRSPSSHHRRLAPQRRAAATDDRAGTPNRCVPNFIPPPTPTTEQEYWQAEQYHFEHGQPAPLPPPRRERDEW